MRVLIVSQVQLLTLPISSFVLSLRSDMLLLSLVLYNCVSAAYVGLKHELAYSCVAFEPVSYVS